MREVGSKRKICSRFMANGVCMTFLKTKHLFFLFLMVFCSNAYAEIATARARELVERIRQVLLSSLPAIDSEHFIISLNTDGNDTLDDTFAGNVDVYGKYRMIYLTLNKFGLSIGDPAALTAVVCHEAGHHLGGAPYSPARSSLGLSIEGQADYWAANFCIPLILRAKVIEPTELLKIDGATELCLKKFKDPSDLSICESVIAIGSRWRVIHQTEVQRFYSHSDPKIVESSLLTDAAKASRFVLSTFSGVDTGHPNDICRFKTYIAGALSEGRPSCWYSP